MFLSRAEPFAFMCLTRWSGSGWRCSLPRRRGSGVCAHIDTALPAAFKRIHHVHRHAADALDRDLCQVTVLEWPQAFVVGTTGDDIAAIEGHDTGSELDECRYSML